MANLRTILILVLLLAGGREVFAEQRIALVLGNGAYEHVGPLPNPVTDARLVGETLKRLGFQVMIETDLSALNEAAV